MLNCFPNIDALMFLLLLRQFLFRELYWNPGPKNKSNLFTIILFYRVDCTLNGNLVVTFSANQNLVFKYHNFLHCVVHLLKVFKLLHILSCDIGRKCICTM